MSTIIDTVKIEKGKITTLIGERQIGITTYLCNLAKELSSTNDSFKTLIVSWCEDAVKMTVEKYREINGFNKNIEQCTIKKLNNKIVGKRYDLIICDCLNCEENNDYIFQLKKIMPDTKIIIGVTSENIAFDSNINNNIRNNFIIKSDYAYYFTLTYNHMLIKYDILEDVLSNKIKKR